MKVIIIGGGVGGLCLAQGLRKNNISVTVFEKQKTAFENLAGYGLHIDRHGRKALKACLQPEDWQRFQELSTGAGTQMFFRDQQLNLLAERDDAIVSGKSADEMERRGIGRLELRDLLLRGLDDVVQWGKVFTHYEQLSSGGVRAHFTDGSSEEGDLLVGADAGHSKVRKQRFPEVDRVDLGIVTIAGRYILTKERIRELPAALSDGSLNNIVPSGKGWMFVSAWHSRAATSNAGAEQDHYVVWAYVLPKGTHPADPTSLAATELQRIALEGAKGWSPHLETIIRDADLSTIACVPLKSMPHLEAWEPSNVTLMGDAIHSMTPMGGNGANTALRDAEAITDVLSSLKAGGDVKSAVGVYENRMREYANSAVGLSRRNAENASSGQMLPRFAFRTLLRVAQKFPPVMNATIGRAVVA